MFSRIKRIATAINAPQFTSRIFISNKNSDYFFRNFVKISLIENKMMSEMDKNNRKDKISLIKIYKINMN
jgi:hypothetical protein